MKASEAEQPDAPHRIGYARVSTDDQRLDLQRDALLLAGVDARDIFEDHASGGPNVKRPGMDAMWLDLRAGDILVIWKLDRLGRDVSELLQAIERIKNLGAQLVVVTEAIDTTTTMGMFVFHIFAALAEMERKMIRERTMAGLAAARLRGRVGGRESKLVGETRAKAAQMLASGAEVADVTAATGISRSVLYAHRKKLIQEASK